jgi:uncharacterized protein
MKKSSASARDAGITPGKPGESAVPSLVIDSREFARTGRDLDGRLPVTKFDRLASLLASDTGELRWAAHGERRERPDGGHDDFLWLQLHGVVEMTCVRCLAGTPIRIEVDRGFRLVSSEAEASREDAEDVEFDVLASAQSFDLGELIEDEAIMALPPIARHDDCELPAGAGLGTDAPPADEPARPNPFAALAALKKPPAAH